MANYFHLLDDGPLSYIMSKLTSPEDLAFAHQVCRQWRDAGIGGQSWKNLCMNISPVLEGALSCVTKAEDHRSIAVTRNVSEVLPDMHEVQESSIEQSRRIEADLFCQLAWELTKPADNHNRIRRALKASSTDNYPEESIEKTLQPSPKWPNPNTPSYWSSKGKLDPQGFETLTYELETPVCLINEVWIRPFQAFFQQGEPIYSSRAVRVRFGYRVSQSQRRSASRGLSRERILDVLEHEPVEEYCWTYESPLFPMKKIDALQRFVLPYPVLCIGGIMQVDLVDCVQSQKFDEMFYVCICHVRAIGRPLSQFDYELNEDMKTVTLMMKNPKSTIGGRPAGLSIGQVHDRAENQRAAIQPQVAEDVADELETRLRQIRDLAATDDVALVVLNWLLANAESLPPNDVLLRILQSVIQPTHEVYGNREEREEDVQGSVLLVE